MTHYFRLTEIHDRKLLDILSKFFLEKKIVNPNPMSVYYTLLKEQLEGDGDPFQKKTAALGALCGLKVDATEDSLTQLDTLGLIERERRYSSYKNSRGEQVCKSLPSIVRLTNDVIDVPLLWGKILFGGG